eukprot:CAMPEP_0177219738 /NCGR_PEP_ID=MMETSP0367-20130122/36521_1 /TAXON_ID=447022 ORGANISM="Scrippsiella hangoei-like, Strain SHHI-4" /NCGR_SAMPLE_ID=MMETSP0367 /ASSEMBLY_ACC=CAM_ASM_000362 /LENGTH=271 /DNA_ID=CAMNT_0018669481 /DNA_START=54 /DNA_END=869 /DNA_ORIENTATION=+
MAQAPAQPGDFEIQAHEQEIRNEAEACALVSPKTSLDDLKAQYASNPGFLPKIDNLGQRFSTMRRTRPDGNCFYRAYTYGIFELIASEPEMLAAFASRVKGSLDFCVSAGYEKVAIEDFYEEFISCLDRLAAAAGAPSVSGDAASAAAVAPATPDELLAECDGYLVCWTRCLTSAFLKVHAEEYVAFLTSHDSIAQFCAQEVDPMAKDADHLQITALSRYFGVPVCVVYLDQSTGDTAAEHVFREDGDATTKVPTVYLLYRPGHYDLIYPA